MATYNDIKKIKIGDNTFVFHVPTASEVGALSDSTTIPAITLNGTANTSPSFYAPTTAGTNGYVLKSNGSGAPTWTSATLTDTKVTTAALTSGTTYYPILATGTGTATRQIDSTLGGLKYISTAGTTSAVGTAVLQLGNATASGTANNEKGVIRLYGTGATYYTDIVSGTPTANRTITLPNKTGTVALTSDVTDSKVTVEDAINNQIYYPILATGTGTATRQVDITGEFKYGRTAEYTSDGVTHPGKASLVLGNLNGLGNGKRIGAISLAGTNQFYSTILSTTLTTDRTITLPNKDGTIALTSDITDAAEIFWATYGTTTKAELDAASAAGKLILLGGPNYYTEILNGSPSSGYVFEKVDTFGWNSLNGLLAFEDYVYYIENDNDGWQTQLNYFYAGNERCRELTQAQYDALTTDEKNDGTTYYITDGDSSLSSAVDCIVDEGSEGIWKYRKWKNGTYEAWGTYNATGLTLTTASGGTYYSTTNPEVNLPSFSVACDYAFGNEQRNVGQISSGIWIYAITTYATKLGIEFRAHSSISSGACGCAFYVHGRWVL